MLIIAQSKAIIQPFQICSQKRFFWGYPTAFSHTCKQIYEIVIDRSLSICVGNPNYRVADLKHIGIFDLLHIGFHPIFYRHGTVNFDVPNIHQGVEKFFSASLILHNITAFSRVFLPNIYLLMR